MSILARSSVFAAMVVVAAAPPALAQRMRAGDSFKDKVAAWRGDAQVSGKIVDDAGKGVPDAKVTFIFTKSNDGFFATLYLIISSPILGNRIGSVLRGK